MSLLDDLSKVLGGLTGDTKLSLDMFDLPTEAVPAQDVIPQQQQVSQQQKRIVPQKVSEPVPDSLGLQESGWAQTIGEGVRTAGDFIGEGWSAIGDDIVEGYETVVGGGGRVIDDFTSGVTGDPSKAIPYQGTKDDKAYADAMLKRQEAIQGIVEKDPQSQAVIEAAGKVDIGDLTRQLQLKGIGEQQFKDLAERTTDGLVDGFSLKEMMSGASDFLGELWGDEAIRNALVYYTGARLMGYSGSGSGMAAGQVLLKGWDNKSKSDLALGVSDAKAASKSAADNAIDTSKTYAMFDKKTRSVVDVYKSKSGRYQQVGTKDIYEATNTNLVDYSAGRHKTHDDLKADLNKVSIDATNSYMQALLKDKDNENNQAVMEMFGDGRATRELINYATAEMRASDRDYSNASFADSIQNLITKAMKAQSDGKRTGDYGKDMASMLGEWEEIKLKQGFTGEGKVPSFVYDKVVWGEGGSITKDTNEFEASGTAKGALRGNLFSLRDSWIEEAKKGGVDPVLARKLITSTKVAQKLAKVFKTTVMKDPIARDYWSNFAKDKDENAFMLWMQSAESGTENKYLSLDSPIVKAEFKEVKF